MTNEPNSKTPLDFIKVLSSIMLSSEDEARMRADLSAYADLHAVQPGLSRSSAPSLISMLMQRTRGLYAGALALVLITAGGTQASFAAENAVPGDVLYSMKVGVSEPLALALSPGERKAELSAQFATRRVDEAVQLLSEGKLDEETAVALAARFDEHVDTLNRETEELEEKGEIAVSLAVRSDLEQKLSERAEDIALTNDAPAEGEAADQGPALMAKIASASTTTDSTEDRFAERITEKTKTLATTRERIESMITKDTDADAAVDLATLRDGNAANLSAGTAVSATMLLDEDALGTGLSASSTASTTDSSGASLQGESQNLLAPFLNR